MSGAGEREGPPPEGRGDWRLTLIAALTVLLGGAVAAVLIASGGSGSQAEPPPAGCVERWNADPAARAFGIHNYGAHRYTRVQMLLVDDRGRPAQRGSCAVVFAAQALDPEPFAAAQVHFAGRWVALTNLGITERRLGLFQSQALDNSNATLGPAGTIRSD